MDGAMMWGMGLGSWLGLLILVLAAAALIKYVFFREAPVVWTSRVLISRARDLTWQVYGRGRRDVQRR